MPATGSRRRPVWRSEVADQQPAGGGLSSDKVVSWGVLAVLAFLAADFVQSRDAQTGEIEQRLRLIVDELKADLRAFVDRNGQDLDELEDRIGQMETRQASEAGTVSTLARRVDRLADDLRRYQQPATRD